MRRIYEAVDRRDFDALSDHFAPEIEIHLAGIFPDLNPLHRGKDAPRILAAHGEEPWEEITIEPDRIIDLGDRLLVLAHFQAKGRDGIEVRRPIAHLWTLRDGQAVRMDAYSDEHEAMAAVNLEIVRKAFMATSGGDPTAAAAAFDPAIEWDMSGVTGWTEKRVYHGREVEEFLREWADSWRDWHFDVVELRSAGDEQVFVAIHEWGTGVESQASVDQRRYFAIALDEGRMRRVQMFSDRGAALEALGLTDRGENVAVMRAAMEAFNRRDGEAFGAHLSRDAEIVPVRAALEGTVYRGPDAAAQYCAAVDESWENLRWEIEEIRDGGSWVLALGRIRGGGRGSGAAIDVRAGWVARFREGLVTSFHTYADRAEALQAVGLSEQDARS